MERIAGTLVICAYLTATPALSESKPKQIQADQPFSKQEMQDTFSNRITAFSNGCEMRYSSNQLPTIVRNCGRLDGTYGAWAWGDSELRIIGRRGQQKSLYFFRQTGGQIYAVDNDRGRWTVTSIR